MILCLKLFLLIFFIPYSTKIPICFAQQNPERLIDIRQIIKVKFFLIFFGAS